MAALDALPPAVRTAVTTSPARHSPKLILEALKDGVREGDLIEAIGVANQQMCADYRQKMATGYFSKRSDHERQDDCPDRADRHCAGEQDADEIHHRG
jgi:hypothetical protein